MAPGSMDLSVIMNKTPVTEKVQEVMDRNSEQRHVHIASEMAKNMEHNARSVNNISRSENPNIDKRKDKKHDEKKRKHSPDEKTGRFIDIEA